MSFSAYVLIETSVGQTAQVRDVLSKLPSVKNIHVITGAFDIIVFLETTSQEQMGETIIKEIRNISGIVHTMTCVVVG